MATARALSKAFMVTVAIVVILGGAGYFATKGNAPAMPAKDPEKASVSIKAEDFVRARSNQFACVSREALERAVGHSVAGEKTKFEAMFQRAECLPLPVAADRNLTRL